MSTALIALALGFGGGVVLLVVLLRRLVSHRARQLFDRWVIEDSRRAVRHGVDDRRAEVKRRLGLDLAPRLSTFPFEAADARFLGHPAHFVIFDGHTDVKDRRADEIRQITFLTVRPGPAPHDLRLGRTRHAPPPIDAALTDSALTDSALIDECVRAGRVRWSTLRLEPAKAEPLA